MPAAADLRTLAPRPWAPLSGAEFAALLALLPDAPEARRRPGRPAANLRRTLDAIFWVACSTGPWKRLPAELGRPGSAHRTLSRWAKAGLLQRLLGKASLADAAPPLRGLAYWLARAFRRMAKLVGTASLVLVRDVLRLADACPASPLLLPDPDLSKTARARLKPLENGLLLYARRVARMARRPDAYAPEPFQEGVRAARAAIRAVRAGWRQVRLGVCGNRHQWKLC